MVFSITKMNEKLRILEAKKKAILMTAQELGYFSFEEENKLRKLNEDIEIEKAKKKCQ